MIQEHKELLLKDLCGRIMYGVKCTVYEDASVHTLYGVLPDNVYNELYFGELDWKECDGFADVQYCKPYLFPLSSMTEEQMEELKELCDMYTPDDDYHPYAYKGIKVLYKHVLDDNYEFNFKIDVINWFNKNHFDYQGLIEKGMAIDATNKNIY